MKRAVIIFLAAGCIMMLIPLFTFGVEEREKIRDTLEVSGGAGEESKTEKDKSQIVESVLQILANMNKGESESKADEPQESFVEEKTEDKVIKVCGSGSFKVLDIATGEILELSELEYLVGALAAEAKADDELEYLKALGIVLNTCALKNREANILGEVKDLDGADFFINSEYDEGYICKEKAEEKFGAGFDEVWEKLSASAEYAAELAVVYGGDLAVTPFHKMSAGKTESAENIWGKEVPYLKMVVSTGDIISSENTSVVKFSSDELKKILCDFDENIVLAEDKGTWFGETMRSQAGYAASVEVGNRILSGTELRIALGLKSSYFDVSENENGFSFTVRGEGHGVGMSQNGANFLAKEGKKCDEIIKTYYIGTEIVLVKR